MHDPLKVPSPCPFCGAEPTAEWDEEAQTYDLGCHNGDCSITATVWGKDWDTLVHAWNIRIPSPPTDFVGRMTASFLLGAAVTVVIVYVVAHATTIH
jgi:hypothetical protein